MGNTSPAQAAGYTANITTAYPQLSISPSATQVNWSSCNSGGALSRYMLCDDGETDIMPIGFSFNFGGTAYSNWSMSSNGVIFFETASSGASSGNNTYTPSNLPTAASVFGTAAKPALMPFWADLQKNASAAGANNVGQPAAASFYQYQVLPQSSGAQVLVIQMKNVMYWNSGGMYVNLQVQLWSTGEIVYAYGAMQAMASNPLLRVGLQYSGGCGTLASNQTTSLSNQSFVYQWDASTAACPTTLTVNHYEIRHDGAATLCAEPVTVLACSIATTPCPAANIMSNLITSQVIVSGLTNVSISPPSFNIQPSAPLQRVNLTWGAGSSGNATLSLSSAVAGNVLCTNVAGTASSNCTMAVTNAACIAPPHHYQVQGPANGTNCANSTFTIKAWADAGETTAYTAGVATGTLTFTGNAVSLPSLGAFTIAAGSSTVNITPIAFPAAGTTTFSTTATPALAGATTCNFGGLASCAFSVTSCVADFNCVETSANAASAADANPATGGLYTKVVGSTFSFDVVARMADGTAATAYASDADKPVSVELVDGSGATACASRTALNPAVTSQTLTFAKVNQPTELGRKSISFSVPNAYRDVRCRVTDNTTTSIKGCSLDDFAIRPPSATLATSPAMATPPSASTANPIKAGATFTLSASTSAGSNYSPSLSLNAALLSAQLTSNVATLQSGGAVGTLTPATLVSNAAAVNTSYSEVGYLFLGAGAFYDAANPAFTAVDSASGHCVAGSFSDTPVGGKVGCGIGTVAASFGRFIPDHFETAIVTRASPLAPLACPAGLTCPSNGGTSASGFIYANQPFTVKVTAKNASGGTTTNYSNSFAKATTLSAWNALGGATANPGAGSLAGASVANTGFVLGVASSPLPSYGTTLPTLLAPTDVYFRATESFGGDGVSSLQNVAANSVEAGLKVASGRIWVPNAYGSERMKLSVPVTVQYFGGGSRWLTSLSDSASSFDSHFTSAAGNVLLTPLSGLGTPLGSALSVVSPAMGTVASGLRSIVFAAPLTAGHANLSITAPAYLPSTTGRATFGLFKSPLIYRRENY